MRFYHALPKTPKVSHEKFTLTLAENQYLTKIQKTDPDENFFARNGQKNGRWKVSVNSKTDTGKLKLVVCQHRDILFIKHNEVPLKMKDCQTLLAKQKHTLSSIDFFLKSYIALEETTVHN